MPDLDGYNPSGEGLHAIEIRKSVDAQAEKGSGMPCRAYA